MVYRDEKPIRVLLIEDSEDDYLLVRRLLSKIETRQFNLDWVRTCQAALDLMERDWHDIYLVDYRLGKEDGLTLLQEAVARGCRAPLILLTGYGGYDVDVKAMQSGAADFLAKNELTPPLLERTVRYAIQHKEAEESLRLSGQRLRALSARQRSVVEQERQRVAREMHDALGHNLTVVRLGLTWLLKRFSRLEELAPEAQIVDKIESLSAIIDSTIQSVRKLTTELRPGVLDTSGLIAAIEWQAQEFEKQTGIICESALPAELLTLDENQSTALYRILQECLTNVARHADATKVSIRLKVDGVALCLEVVDNGKGIGEDEIVDPRSFGLLGMRERAIALGGEVQFPVVRGKGTSVIVQVPLTPGSTQQFRLARRTAYEAPNLSGRDGAQGDAPKGLRA